MHICIVNETHMRMNKRTLLSNPSHLLLLILLLGNGCVFAQAASNTLKSSGLAPVNGLNMYYEIHGQGNLLCCFTAVT